MRKTKITAPPGGQKKSGRNAYPFEVRLRAVRLYTEEEYSSELIAEELGMSSHTVYGWVKRYKEQGEEGLKPKTRSPQKRKLPPAVREKIVELKEGNPTFGIRRISDLLKRFFFMQASPRTVCKTLHEEEMIEPPPKKRKRNPGKPRFFERSTPNQMWQSDIMSFRLAGRQAYLIGYIDDYSRYITGLGLYRSQTAEHVLETYRRAIAEYGVPKEMLTDNGRQYTNWRGTTKFEKELKKDRIKHIKSQPHHPMTLGKIERFWKSILTEFLNRAQFGSFEETQSRLAMWVKYYNHKRPHQGIGSLCPADRFFEINNSLKTVLEEGIEDNTLEMALRGKPVDPFYMVGRMGDQNVVIRAEKGKVRMMVDGEEETRNKELVYQVEKGEKTDEKAQNTQEVYSNRERESSLVNMGGEENYERDLRRDGDQSEPGESLAGSGNGGYVKESGPCPVQRESPSFKQEIREDALEEERHFRSFEAGRKVGENPNQQREKVGVNHVRKETAAFSAEACGSYPESPERSDDSFRSSPGNGSIPQDVLQVGKTSSGRDGERVGDPAWRPPREETRPREGRVEREVGNSGERAFHPGAEAEYPQGHQRPDSYASGGEKKIDEGYTW